VSALVALPGNAILSGGDDGRLRYWDSVGHLLRSFNSGHNSIMSLLRLRQGSILSGGSERLTEAESSSIRSWLPPKTGLDNQILPGQIESLSLVELCNGDLISGASDGALYHWRDGHRLGQPIQTTHRRVDALTLLPSGDLVSGGDDGTLQVWRNGQVVARAPTDQGGVTSLATLVDGSLLSGGRDGSIRHLQLEDGALRRISSMHSHHGAVWAIAPLPDGDVLSGGDDGLIRRWRRGRQQGIALKTPHTTVVSLVVRSNGDWVSGGSGGDIQLWREGRRLGDFFHVDSGSVWSLVERRNRQIVSANGDGTIFT
jgi:phospholipase A-2-activating protein